ncbi:MAG TPA: methylenetetrahydrofolate reductase [NAD(P)H], partial [Crenotrichaceae bacterium]|nr:methylenetetrahydrofolate reductase [NAD(P)H] [Crenotrichaceae bacterium]
MQSQQKHPKSYSFEFFPPRTDDGLVKLRSVWQNLATVKPDFFSVTYGAGGSTRDNTMKTVTSIQRDTGIEVAHHLSCVAATFDSIDEILQQFKINGIKRIVALRGDMPSGMHVRGDFNYASDLVAFIRKQTGDYFQIEVAAYPEMHPQAENPVADITNFKTKVDAGADRAITQYFYNIDAYFAFIDECEKNNIDVPILPGIMPIINFSQLARFSDACGAEIPRWMRKRLEG